tara:strand:- start:367 stop:585 length:219 start_codon:yes stop_codon:yes gene_type:complete
MEYRVEKYLMSTNTSLLEYPTCAQCHQECEPIIVKYDEKVEYWGGITYEPVYEVFSNCCDYDVDLPTNYILL